MTIEQDKSSRLPGARPMTTETVARATREKRWRSRKVRWRVRLLVATMLIGGPVIFGLDCLFYFPDRVVYHTPDEFGLTYEDVTFPARDGTKLHGWFLPAVGAAKGTVVHFHGNAANISNHLALVWWLPEIGYNLLLFDYRGFGQSASRPTRAGTIDDGHGALDYLLTRKDVDPDRIVAYGQSIGGAVATVVAAARSEIRALIAETTFDSYRAIATDHLSRKIYSRFLADKIVRATIGSAHDPLEAIVALAPRPLLMIVAEEDQICFPERGMELYEAAREPKSLWRVPQAGHLGIERVASVELRRRVGDFLDAVCASSARNSP